MRLNPTSYLIRVAVCLCCCIICERIRTKVAVGCPASSSCFSLTFVVVRNVTRIPFRGCLTNTKAEVRQLANDLLYIHRASVPVVLTAGESCFLISSDPIL